MRHHSVPQLEDPVVDWHPESITVLASRSLHVSSRETHRPEQSHVPAVEYALVVHEVPMGLRASAGHLVDTPSHVSTTSHDPAEARHTVPFAAGPVPAALQHPSRDVHTFPDKRLHVVPSHLASYPEHWFPGQSHSSLPWTMPSPHTASVTFHSSGSSCSRHAGKVAVL